MVWAQEALQSAPERRLLFVYLANDIMQNSRRKGAEFVKEFGEQLKNVLPEAYTNSSESVRSKLMRLIGIWEERRVLESDVLNDLRVRMMSHSGPETMSEPRVEASNAAGSTTTPAVPSPLEPSPTEATPKSHSPRRAGLPLPEFLDSLNEGSFAEKLQAERDRDLPMGALSTDGPELDALEPELLTKAATLLPTHIEQLKQELAERQALLLLLAAACEKQAAHFPRLQGAIGECEEVLERVKGRTETDKASDRERIMIDVKEGQYSPSDN